MIKVRYTKSPNRFKNDVEERKTPNRFKNDVAEEKLPRLFKNRHLALLTSLFVLLLVPTIVVFTLAYNTDSTDEIINEFDPKEVVININETFKGKVKKDVSIQNTGDLPAYIRFKLSISAVDEEGNTVALPIRIIDTSNTVADLTSRSITIDDFTITQKGWEGKFITDDGIYYYPDLVDVGGVVEVFTKATFNLPVFDPSVIDLPLPLMDDDDNPYYVFDGDRNLHCKYNETTGEYESYSKNEMSKNGYTNMLGDDGKFTYMLSTYNPVITITAESVQANGVEDAWGVTVENGKIIVPNE